MTSATVKCAKNLLITSSSILLLKSNEIALVIPWALILILLPIHHISPTPSFETFTGTPTATAYSSPLSRNWAHFWHTCVHQVFWWYWHGARSIIWSSSTGLSFGLFFRELCLHLRFTRWYCCLLQKRCKNTHAIFQQLSKETMQERDPSRGHRMQLQRW